jgi:hypothetical protein
MPVQETKYVDPDLVVSDAITEEDREALAKKMEAMDRLLSDEQKKARYKLEVFFDEERSVHKPFGGIVTWWESGTKFHGGGDTKMYACDNNANFPRLEGKGCKALMPESSSGFNFLVCPKCGTLWKNEEVAGEIYYRLPVQKWALVLLSWFRRLDHDADIRIKYARDDIRSVAMLEVERDRGGELLHRVRSEERRSISTYPLMNIIKDTSAGADLYQRILAFLQA